MIGAEQFVEAVFVGVWAYLYTGPLSEPGQVFAPVRALVYRMLAPAADGWRLGLYKVLTYCAKCHAGQVALWLQVYNLATGKGMICIQYIITAIFAAEILETWKTTKSNKAR